VTTATGATPVRVQAIAVCQAAGTSVIVRLGPGNQNVATGTTDFSGVQVEVGSYATSYVSTAAAAVARNADVITATNPFQATNPPNWCVSGQYTAESGAAWANQGFWTLGTYSLANSARATTIGGTYFFQTSDGAMAVRSTSISAGGFATSLRLGDSDISGAQSIYQNGAVVVPGPGAGGTGVITQPSTLTIGQDTAASTFLGGFLQNMKFCKNACSTCR
jgi:hypothetical protein